MAEMDRKRQLLALPVPGVIGFLGNNLPHAPLRPRGITCVTGNQMDVDVEDTLPRGRTYINADVVAVGFEFVIQCCSYLHNRSIQAVTSSGVRSKKLAQCRNGIIREWPGLTG